MRKLEDMRVGDWVRWDSRDWEVTDRDGYRESADYSETQWELAPRSGAAYYLVRSQEQKADGLEEVWVCTTQTGISTVEFRKDSGGWRAFKEKDSLLAPPGQARYQGVEFSLDGKSEVRAEDDDGNTVPKFTWDYYDQDRKRNIAIEIWREPDADYYEAYQGVVVRPSDFEPLPPRASVSRGRVNGETAGSLAVAAAFAAFFFVPLGGAVMTACNVGAEYLLALLLPAAFVGFSFLRGAHRGLLYSSLAGSLALAIILLRLRGLGGSYWEYAVYGVLAGSVITEGASRLFGGIRTSDKAMSAGNAALLLLFIVSFAHYIKVAPRPHNGSGLLAACVLPVLPALLVYFIYVFKGGSDEPA
ncbi:MAG: DUF4178 domain-containing protein [Elusimicrobiota bacterium]|nr:DUF4178 domain-containing protein [Elusimicrobiota bacterium]